MPGVLIKRGKFGHRDMYTGRMPCEHCCYAAKKLPESNGPGKDPSLEPSEGAWPWQHLDLGLLASRTVREYISVV